MASTSLLSSTMGLPSLQDTLEKAASLVDRSLQADRSYCDLSDLLLVSKHTMPTVSGLHDFDYPSLSDPKIALGSLHELDQPRPVPLPAELVEKFGHMQCNCNMGLFPEISRAWLSIDSDIFVWNYEDGTDLAYFDGLSEAIIGAGLVRPKRGVFQPHIAYLLCLATPVDIVLLGVSFSNPSKTSIAEMHLLPEPLFSIQTDCVHIQSVTGADNGRIFMAGKDGCLYELHYQAEDGWFSRKCRKINHSTSKLSFMVPSFLNFSFVEDDPLVQISIDNSRNILYTRSEKGTIQVYDLGEDGKGMSRVAAISQQTTMQHASLVARTIDRSNFKAIVHIGAIPKFDSTNVHLVAITQTGVRLYFTTNPFDDNRGRPSMLSMVHVRLPPGFSASAAPLKPSNIHLAHYKKGTLLLAARQSEDNDLLWAVGPDSFPFQRQLMETHETLPLGGRTWAVAEVPIPAMTFEEDAIQGPLQRASPPLVVTQHMEPTRRFVILNSQGSYLINKFTPADQLKHLLLSNAGPDADEVQAFFKLHKEDQACATCLILACSNLNQAEQQVSEWATVAFFLFGGEPEYNYNQGPAPNLSGAPATLSGPSMLGQSFTPGPTFQPGVVSTPYSNMNQSLSQSMNVAQEIIFSGKHNGLCLYLGRVLRPIWEYRMVSDVPCQTPQGQMQYLTSRFRSDELSWFLEQLKAIKCFMEKNSQFSSPIMAESYSAAHSMAQRMVPGRFESTIDEQTQRKCQAEAAAQENASLQQLLRLVERAVEALGLWKTLCDHQFHIIASGLTKDQQNMLRTLTFSLFVTTGKEVASALVQCLINRYLSDNAATDAISSKLREVCPSLYSTEDAVCSKANEMLQVARSTKPTSDRESLLRDALKLYKQITLQLDLPTVCKQFAAARFYAGIVDLALTAADRRDPKGLALHYHRQGEVQEDIHGMHAYMARKDCYKCITETLEYLLSTSLSHPQAPSVPKSPGPPPTPDPNTLTNAEAEQYSEAVFSLCLKSDDEMFHVALYEWLIACNLTEKLLDIQSPFLEPFLKRAASAQADQLPMLDLLWRYYEKTRNFSAAARILAKLADRHSTELSLRQRIEYLSRAAVSAKSSTMRTSSAAEGEFLHELEEKMEVARLQLQIFDTLSRGPHSPQTQDALSRLNSELMDITTLYGDFADAFDLAECKLGIIHCAGHYDPTLVESMWQDIIDKELGRTQRDQAKVRMTTLGTKLRTLGGVYSGTERYFPLAFIVKHLERQSCQLNFDPEFVYRTMQDVGVGTPKLHEVYDRLFKSKDPCWQAMKRPFYLLDVIRHLLEGFADNPNTVPNYERRQFVTGSLDAVASYLIDLQATSTTNTNVRGLIADFKALQAKLECNF